MKKIIYVIYPNLRPFPGNQKKFRTSWQGNTTTTMCPNDFKNLENANEV
jgi:hypothetical protein